MTTTIGPAVRSGILRINGADLYHEIRGSGPAVLFISGAFGDAGIWTRVADLLADRFTVVSYDRRGNSRSAGPAGSAATTVAEQADDAAGLIDRLAIAPVAVLGSSAGAVIALELVAHHPGLVRLALVHEPPLVSVLPNANELGTQLRAMVQEGFAHGGPRGAAELFIRANAGDETFETLDPALRSRLLGNAAWFFTAEVEAFTAYRPALEALRSSNVPIIVLGGAESRGVYYHEAALWVAGNTGSEFVEVPGAHVPYLTCPEAFVHELRPLLTGSSTRPSR